MKIELSEQDIVNTVEFLSRAPIKGAESFVMAILIQTFKVALQPTEAPPADEEAEASASENGATPKSAKTRKRTT